MLSFFAGGLMSGWTKHYCTYQKENKILTMIPYTQTMGKMVSHYAYEIVHGFISFQLILTSLTHQLR